MACVFVLKIIIIWLGIQLSFQEFVTNDCGSLSYDEPAVAGRNVTITFIPGQVVNNESVIWQTSIGLQIYWFAVTEQWKYHLDNFSLVINTSTGDHGRLFYTYYGSCLTKFITLKLEERPNNPELLNTRSIEDCRNCIVGNLNHNLTIGCNVTGGTAPVHVDINVAGARLNAYLDTDGIYTASVRLTAERHMEDVRCSVANLALDSPLFSEANLYIAVIPPEPVFDVPEMRDDAPLTYPTCTSSGARPPSDVKFKSSNSEISNAGRTTRAEKANLYNTSVTLIKMERAWNLQTLTCCVSHFTYSQEWCQSKRLVYKFKPESVRVVLAENYTAVLPHYTYNVKCTVRRAYPACSVTLVWPKGVDKLDSTESFDGTNVVTTEAQISLNVSRKDNGGNVSCTAVCSDISFNQSEVQVIFVPYERTISFNVSSSINIMESTTTTIECKASWASTVMWLDSENRTALLVVDCGTGAACLRLESVSEKHVGNSTCLASDKLYNVSKQLTVTVIGNSDQDFSTMIVVIIITSGIVLLLVAAVILVVDVKRRRTSKKLEVLRKSPETERNTEVLGANDSTTYQNTAYADESNDALPPVQAGTSRNNEQNEPRGGAHKELIYADLELTGSSDGTANSDVKPKPRIIGSENATEYVEVDFTKKAPPQATPEPEPEPELEEDDIYMNQ